MRRCLENFIRDAVWDRDFDEVLIGRHHQIGVHQLFQQRGGIVLRGVDDRARMGVPASGIPAGAFGNLDGEGTVPVPAGVAFSGSVGVLYAPTPPRYLPPALRALS